LKVLLTGSSWKIGIAAAYSLTQKGLTVVGTDEHKLPFNIHSRHLSAHYIHAPFSEDKYLEDILAIIKKENPDVLLPLGGTKQISLNKNMIEKYVNVLVPDYECYIMAYHKQQTYKICKEAGIAMPHRYSYDEASKVLRDRKTKLVIKPDFDIGGATRLSIVSTVKQLDIAIKYIEDIPCKYVIEEYIPGSSTMRAVQILFDKKNKVLEYFILKKIRQWPATGGITAYAESTNENNLLEFVMPFFELCRWEGPVEVELIIDERDGRPKLIEVNPRFPGSISFAIQCGINFPFITCMAAINKGYAHTPSRYESGIYYMNSSYYLRSVIKELSKTKINVPLLYEIFKELKQKKAGTLIDKKDFKVCMAKALNELKLFSN
jgi:predicted ATP-grasp superfamily ATP-dependent carboligase